MVLLQVEGHSVTVDALGWSQTDYRAALGLVSRRCDVESEFLCPGDYQVC